MLSLLLCFVAVIVVLITSVFCSYTDAAVAISFDAAGDVTLVCYPSWFSWK